MTTSLILGFACVTNLFAASLGFTGSFLDACNVGVGVTAGLMCIYSMMEEVHGKNN